MRIGILGLLQESNTFVSAKTTLANFAEDVLARGEEVRTRFQHALHEIGGFFSSLEQEGLEAVPVFVARALPYGVIEARAWDQLMALMFSELEKCGPLDGILVAPHGATVSEDFPDADGAWLTRLRQRLGAEIPIVGTIDPHANLSPAMVAACNALIAYRTNPHIDQRERGIEAASLLARMLRNECRPTMSASFPPFAMSIDQQSTDEEPCQSLMQLAENLRQIPGVITASFVIGFPYADVPEMGSSAIVVTDNDHQLADRCAQQLAEAIWESRLHIPLRYDVQQAIDQALESAGPVCLLDMGDNVGGGSPADGTWIARALYERRIAHSFVCLCDADAVQLAITAGVGCSVRMNVGGKHSLLSGEPLLAQFEIVGIYPGHFRDEGVTHGGFTSFDQGPTAVLLAESGLTVLVTSRRMVPFSLAQLRSCGLEPANYRILVAKGVNAPIAAYREVCPTFIRVDTPGVTTADMTRLEFANRRHPLLPFESDFSWDFAPTQDCGRRVCS